MEKGSKRGKKTVGRTRARLARQENVVVFVGRRNVRFLGAALVAIALGFGALALGSISISTILLVGGYLVLVPWAILAGSGGAGDSPKPSA
ncbi:MAG: hypothetical protein KAY24_05290 [Candidatus Eisenbacteria sp.]|nr:hypothetical protein [Candidatus Eisenbacteria bacterium]